MIADEPIYSITSKITTTPISITRRFLFSCPRKARKNTKGRTVFFSIPFVFSVDLLFFIRVDPCLPSWFPIQERGSRQYQPIHELFVHGRHEKTRKGERCSFPCLSCFPWTFSSLFVSIRVCLRGSRFRSVEAGSINRSTNYLSTEGTKKHERENGVLFRAFRVFRGPSLLYSCRFVVAFVVPLKKDTVASNVETRYW